VIAPAILSPIICFLVAGTATFVVFRLIKKLQQGEARRGYRYGQIGSATNFGILAMAALTALAAAALFVLAQRNKIAAGDLDRTHVTPEREAQISRQPATATA
jgi:hypothetical protein